MSDRVGAVKWSKMDLDLSEDKVSRTDGSRY